MPKQPAKESPPNATQPGLLGSIPIATTQPLAKDPPVTEAVLEGSSEFLASMNGCIGTRVITQTKPDDLEA